MANKTKSEQVKEWIEKLTTELKNYLPRIKAQNQMIKEEGLSVALFFKSLGLYLYGLFLMVVSRSYSLYGLMAFCLIYST